jgi:hypothetical protein
MHIRFSVDNVLYADTDPAGKYKDPFASGVTEGDWLLLPSGDRLGTWCWESQGHAGNPKGTNESWVGADFFIDEGYNRVELCNARTFKASTYCAPQPYTAWPADNGSLVITLNIGTIPANATAYLYLFNASDTPSAGHPVKLGAGAASNRGTDDPSGGTATRLAWAPIYVLPVALVLTRRKRRL